MRYNASFLKKILNINTTYIEILNIEPCSPSVHKSHTFPSGNFILYANYSVHFVFYQVFFC